MKDESVLDLLMYLFEHYMDEESHLQADPDTLKQQLQAAGFQNGQINKAFDWLDELAWRQGALTENAHNTTQSMRVYTDREQQRIDMEIQGMLLYLEQIGILDPISRELVIERAMALETQELEAEDVKWIVLLVLLNQPGQESAFALMEELIYNGDPGQLH